jgi:hypothetical protein
VIRQLQASQCGLGMKLQTAQLRQRMLAGAAVLPGQVGGYDVKRFLQIQAQT